MDVQIVFYINGNGGKMVNPVIGYFRVTELIKRNFSNEINGFVMCHVNDFNKCYL